MATEHGMCVVPTALPTKVIIQNKLHESLTLLILRPGLCILMQKSAILNTRRSFLDCFQQNYELEVFGQPKKISNFSKPAKLLRLENKHKSNSNKQQDLSHSKLVPSTSVLVCPYFPWSPMFLLPFSVWSRSDLECVYRSLLVQVLPTCLYNPQSCTSNCICVILPFHFFFLVMYVLTHPATDLKSVISPGLDMSSSQPHRSHVTVIILGSCKCVFLLLLNVCPTVPLM